MKSVLRLFLPMLLCISQTIAAGQVIYQLNYLSPQDAQAALQPQSSNKGLMLMFDEKPVWLHFNEANNQIGLAGDGDAVQQVQDLLKFYDVPPRQIIIEVQILEVNRQKLNEIGVDWQYLLDRFGFSAALSVNGEDSERKFSRDYEDPSVTFNNYTEDQSDQTNRVTVNLGMTNWNLGDFVRLIQDNGTGKLVAAPKIVTTNNREGSILDGAHVTYVSRYSSYANIYETKDINTGLSLKVTPSIGAQDFLTMNVEAKYTSLSGSISGSPIETGQILTNRIIAQNNTPFLLGAFKKTETQTSRHKLPLLGWVLPYLFSREVSVDVQKDILIVLKPQIIDMQGSSVPPLDN